MMFEVRFNCMDTADHVADGMSKGSNRTLDAKTIASWGMAASP